MGNRALLVFLEVAEENLQKLGKSQGKTGGVLGRW